jgi:hypothetical protein
VEDIGELRGAVGSLQDAAREAAADRRDIADKMERVNDRVAVLDAVAVKVHAMVPVVEDYKKLRENINGGLVVIAGLGAVLFTAIGFVLAKVAPWLLDRIHWK